MAATSLGLLWLALILLSLLIAHYILAPLTELSHAARAIRRGRFGVRMPESKMTV